MSPHGSQHHVLVFMRFNSCHMTITCYMAIMVDSSGNALHVGSRSCLHEPFTALDFLSVASQLPFRTSVIFNHMFKSMFKHICLNIHSLGSPVQYLASHYIDAKRHSLFFAFLNMHSDIYIQTYMFKYIFIQNTWALIDQC